MKQAFINIIGHNASGKTTLAKKLEEDLDISRIAGDDFKNFIIKHIRYFNGMRLSYPSERGDRLRPLAVEYRLHLTRILLEAGHSVIFDGSGFNLADRKPMQAVLADFPHVTYIIVKTELPETELLERLEIRGEHWKNMYHDIRKNSFEPPSEAETANYLRYTQQNYEEVKRQIVELLK